MTEKVRPYLFYDVAISICSTCFQRIDAKIVFEDNKVWMLKRCPQHGHQRVLVADDVDYYRRSREVFLKRPEQPMVYNTPVKYGCPYDCGLCPDHEQHSCLTLVEICDACNLTCPICYAGSGQHRTEFRSLEQIEAMLDCVVRNEKQPDVVQISGGEPTLHPDFFRVLEMCKERPIRHLMVNTNGIRIAQDEEFAKRLAGFIPEFEIYLQFDSLERDPLMQLRGADLRSIRQKALERLNKLGISTTLVVTVERGVNDNELGSIIDFALQQPAVRGVTIQPVQQAGRVQGFSSSEHRLTLTEVRRRILEQTSVFRPEDLIPVPCHPDALAMAYALKLGNKVVPLTGLVAPEVLIDGAQHHRLRAGGGPARSPLQAVRDQSFAVFAGIHPARVALLPAENPHPERPWLQEPVSRADCPIH
ncbi:MAG TPA: radical SAM protein [Terracidiphilus sp.]|nr:radical SAM protein [Terracidiphilus sp.]